MWAHICGEVQRLSTQSWEEGLDKARIDELRSLSLLYDCAGNGEFPHAYTNALDDRFCFEIVLLRGGPSNMGP